MAAWVLGVCGGREHSGALRRVPDESDLFATELLCCCAAVLKERFRIVRAEAQDTGRTADDFAFVTHPLFLFLYRQSMRCQSISLLT